MKNQSTKKILHSVLFHIFWGLVLYIEVLNPEQKVALLSVTALSFTALHFKFFTENFNREIIFLGAGFLLGFALETFLSNLGIYQYGIVDFPAFSWPPPWIAALWLMFPPFFSFTLGFLKNYQIIGSFIVATSTLGTYYFVGKRFDLLFFEEPYQNSFVLFILSWYVVIRVLILLKGKLVRQFEQENS